MFNGHFDQGFAEIVTCVDGSDFGKPVSWGAALYVAILCGASIAAAMLG